MNQIHEKLSEKFSWYKSWHEVPLASVLHWVTFIVLAILFINFGYSINIDISKSSASNGNSEVKINKRKGGFDPEHILVKFKDNVGQSKKNDILTKQGLTEEAEITDIKVKLVKISPNDTPEEVVDRLNANEKDSIDFAEVNAKVYADYIPNDPQYGNNWQLPKMSAPAAWDMTTGSQSVIIAILDTGTNCNHEDLMGHCMAGWNEAENNSDTSDSNGHGTGTAGTAAAIGDNGIGIASPCYNCKILPIKIVSGGNSYSDYFWIANGLTYAADHGAKVANISFGPLGGQGGTVSNAAKYFMSKGGVVVIAEGNDGINSNLPDDPYMLSISGIDPNDALYGWSTYGNDVDLAGAGCVTLPYFGGGYSNWCGTSFASPTVAGVAGLIYSKNPSLTGNQVVNILKSNTNDVYTPGYDIYSGFGTPNMAAAIAAAGGGSAPADTTPPSAPTLSGSATSATRIDLSWTPSSDNVGVAGYNVYRNGSKLSTSGGTYFTDSNASPSTSYSYYVTAYDAAGNNSAQSNTISVTTPVLVTNVTISSKQVTNKSATSVTITWTTNVDSTGKVSFGKTANALTSTVTDSTVGKTHSATLTGLTSLTNYYYQITAVSGDNGSTAISAATSFKTSKK
jgi:thermitase